MLRATPNSPRASELTDFVHEDHAATTPRPSLAGPLSEQEPSPFWNTGYRLLYEEASDSIFTLDVTGRIVAANPATERLGGYSMDDWARTHFSEVLLPEYTEAVGAAFAQLLQGERVAAIEYGMRTKGGRELYLSASLLPVIVDGEVVSIEGIARDITHLREWSEKLRASEERYRLLAETARDVIWTADLTGTYTYMSQAVVDHLGYSPDELVGQTYNLILSDEDALRVATMIAEGLEGNRDDARVELEMRRKDGSQVWCEVDVTLQQDADGRPLGLHGITRDISARKADEEVQRQRSAFEQLLGTISKSLINLDPDALDDATVDALRQVAEFMGAYNAHIRLLDPATGLYLKPYTWWRSVSENAMAISIAPLAEEALPWFFTQLREHRTVNLRSIADLPEDAYQEQLYVEMTGLTAIAAVALIVDDELIGFLAIQSDEPGHVWPEGTLGLLPLVADIFLTALQRRDALAAHARLEAQFQQAQKMEAVGTLAGGIAHDFNNLLTGILGSVELALMDVPAEGDLAALLRQAQEAANRGSALTRHLLTLSRKRERELGSVDINAVVRQTVELLDHSISEAISIRLNTDASIPTITGDAGQLEQALLNLGINARDAMPTGGELTFTTSLVTLTADEAASIRNARAGEFVRVTVGDTGVGIPESVLHRIFEPFFTTKPQGQGTGLGLAMVYSCAQAHDGWLDVSSELGRGTAFQVFLPVLDATADREVPESTPIPRGTETLLLVDDTDEVLTTGRNMLERCGYTVLTANNGNEALEQLSTHGDDVAAVVTDLVMPHCGGRSLLQRMQSCGMQQPVIVTSGYAMDAVPADLIDEGFAEFIDKPFDMRTIATAVRRALDATA